jgi:hypothetical protein
MGIRWTIMGSGFETLGMPRYRWDAAKEIVGDVLAANDARVFRWYATPAVFELCGWWDDAEKNLLWVWANNVHTCVEDGVPLCRLPDRPVTYRTDDATVRVGWMLPGGTRGDGGGPQRARAVQVRCPETTMLVPAGQECSYCEQVHDA